MLKKKKQLYVNFSILKPHFLQNKKKKMKMKSFEIHSTQLVLSVWLGLGNEVQALNRQKLNNK